MRIALLSHEYPTETGFGGIGTYTWFHARALARLGHDVHVFAGSTSRGFLRLDQDGDGVHVWRSLGDGVSAALHERLGKMQLWWYRERVRNALDMWTAFRRVHRQHPFDIVEMPECGAEGAMITRFSRLPTVVRFHSPARLIMPYYEVSDRDLRWTSRLEEGAISRATALSSTSHFLAREITKIGVTRSVETIHNGIDLAWFDADEETDVLQRFGIPNDKPVILFTGRLERRKGIHLCPSIVASIVERHNCAFVFAGADLFGFVDGQLMPELQKRSLRGSVHVLGRLSPRDVRTCLRRADIVFLPSLWESCPYACLEAMSARRGIVASDAGGFPELLAHRQNALVVPSGDKVGFERALEELLSDASLRRHLGEAARRTVETSFQDVQVARATLKFYEHVTR